MTDITRWLTPNQKAYLGRIGLLVEDFGMYGQVKVSGALVNQLLWLVEASEVS